MHFPNALRDGVGGFAPPPDKELPPRVIACPLRQAAVAKKILKVEAKFFETGTGHIRQFQLHLLRRAAGFASLGDVLHAAARGLHHLIMSAAAPIDVSIAKTNSTS